MIRPNSLSALLLTLLTIGSLQANASLTFFGGMDQALYDDFKKDIGGQINGTENTLKHTASHYGPGHMASNRKIV